MTIEKLSGKGLLFLYNNYEFSIDYLQIIYRSFIIIINYLSELLKLSIET